MLIYERCQHGFWTHRFTEPKVIALTADNYLRLISTKCCAIKCWVVYVMRAQHWFSRFEIMSRALNNSVDFSFLIFLFLSFFHGWYSGRVEMFRPLCKHTCLLIYNTRSRLLKSNFLPEFHHHQQRHVIVMNRFNYGVYRPGHQPGNKVARTCFPLVWYFQSFLFLWIHFHKVRTHTQK